MTKTKTFSELVQALNERSNEEEKYLKPKAKGEKKFADLHTVKLTKHPVAADSVYKGVTKPIGDHDGPEGSGEGIIKQGSSGIKNTHDGSKKADSSKAVPKRQGDLKIIKPIKEDEELDELSRKTLSRYVRKSALDATQSAVDLTKKTTRAKSYDQWTDPAIIYDRKRVNKRLKGVRMATDRLAKEEYDLTETVISNLQNIVSSKKNGSVKFSNGQTESIDYNTAFALVRTYNRLNPTSKKKFEESVNKDFTSFMKMVDFAVSKGK